MQKIPKSLISKILMWENDLYHILEDAQNKEKPTNNEVVEYIYMKMNLK